MSYNIDFAVTRNDDLKEEALEVISVTSTFEGSVPSSEEIAECIIENALYAEKLAPTFKQRPVTVQFENGKVWVEVDVPVLRNTEIDLDAEGLSPSVIAQFQSFRTMVRNNIDRIMYVETYIQKSLETAVHHQRNTQGYTTAHLPNTSMMRLDMLKEILPKTEHHFLASENDNIYRAASMLAHHYKNVGLF